MTSTLPVMQPGDTDEWGNRLIVNEPDYVIATENDGAISAYVSIRCRDDQSWMAPLVSFLAEHSGQSVASGGRRPNYTIEHEERIEDRTMVGGAAWFRRYRLS